MNLISKALAASANDLRLSISTTNTTLDGLLGTLVNWVALIAGIVAFFYLVYSGFLYLTSAGNAEQSKKGGAGILNAVIGIIIILLSWVLVTAIGGGFRITN